MPEGTTPARGAGRARGRGTRGRGVGRGAAVSVTPSAETPAPTSRPSSALDTAPATAGASRDSATPRPAPTRGPSVGRFRPKVVRRDEASRDAIARQELEKDNARAKAEARAQARSRGRSRRARGDAMGRGGFMSRTAVASGPFSQMNIEGGGRSGGGWGGGGGGGGGGFFGGGGGGRTKREGGGFGEASGHREARINADRLAGYAVDREPDSDDEATAALISSKPDNIWPMGIARIDKKEEKKVIATSAELEAEEQGKAEESLWVDANEAWPGAVPRVEEETKVWHAAPKGMVHVKAEPGAEPGAMDIAPVDFNARVKSSTPDAEEKVTPEPKTKKTAADPEVEMITHDMQLLLGELGTVSDENSKAPESEAIQDKDGRLYLFQFPPLLPPLHPTTAPKVKPEPDDVVMMDPPGEAVDLTNSEENIRAKAEEDKDIDLTDINQLVSQAGMMGKLKVRKSGKVELDWGGRTLELSPAAGMNFLTTAVIVEESDEKTKPGVVGGDSIGMGKIMGRFVLAPTWGDEEEWEVDPDDLAIPSE
ncbi:RNA polymerase III RPC4-domain-containing protein [Colletotrichum navitas]|uniref:RNA polymerase III RPC4-domain-containing protein n=1 Tax=Colletotrichum navitas TaxID=681940 RepID=A0AAD8Q3C1_9PEZI|nr:RNA polymerase III RPC4-domain-containing protein [Colletotrichum navitas]KAK1594748.1 RNA polymerase III RPC4-domain-containing protein [Colletotrichum navitas]